MSRRRFGMRLTSRAIPWRSSRRRSPDGNRSLRSRLSIGSMPSATFMSRARRGQAAAAAGRRDGRPGPSPLLSHVIGGTQEYGRSGRGEQLAEPREAAEGAVWVNPGREGLRPERRLVFSMAVENTNHVGSGASVLVAQAGFGRAAPQFPSAPQLHPGSGEDLPERITGGHRHPHLARRHPDAGSDLQQPHPNGGHLRPRQLRPF